LSKNTRWALALIGVVIIIVGAVVIGTGSDSTDAVQEPGTEATAETGPTQSAPATPATGSTGSDNGGGSGNNDEGNGTGGASPSNPDSGQGSGGASPGQSPDSSGGAEARVGVVSPVLAAGKVRTIKVEKGQTVMIRATSTTTGEMHVHGYDKEISLKPGEIVRVKLKATIDGEFPIEFHLPAGDEEDVAILQVSP
jgi:hypothetical protein